MLSLGPARLILNADQAVISENHGNSGQGRLITMQTPFRVNGLTHKHAQRLDVYRRWNTALVQLHARCRGMMGPLASSASILPTL